MRRPDWPERLAEYVEARRAATFEWGVHDCCRFASGAVEAMTGDDPMGAFAYRNEVGALRLVHTAGSLDALVMRTLGDPLEAVALAGRGDVVIAELENGSTVGICLGADCVFVSEAGVTFRPLSMARVAWRID